MPVKLSMKPFNFRAAFPIKRPVQKPRSIYSPRRHAKHQPHHGNTRKRRVPDRTPRHRTPHRPQHRRNRDGVRIYSKRQRQRQHRRSRQNRRRNVLPQLCRHREMCRARIRKPRASARKIFVPVWKCAHHKAYQHQHHRNRGDVRTFSKRQRQRQHRRWFQRNERKVIAPRKSFCRKKIYRARLCNPHANAQTIFVPVRKHAHRRAHQHQHHRSKDDVPTFSKQQKRR